MSTFPVPPLPPGPVKTMKPPAPGTDATGLPGGFPSVMRDAGQPVNGLGVGPSGPSTSPEVAPETLPPSGDPGPMGIPSEDTHVPAGTHTVPPVPEGPVGPTRPAPVGPTSSAPVPPPVIDGPTLAAPVPNVPAPVIRPTLTGSTLPGNALPEAPMGRPDLAGTTPTHPPIERPTLATTPPTAPPVQQPTLPGSPPVAPPVMRPTLAAQPPTIPSAEPPTLSVAPPVGPPVDRPTLRAPALPALAPELAEVVKPTEGDPTLERLSSILRRAGSAVTPAPVASRPGSGSGPAPAGPSGVLPPTTGSPVPPVAPSGIPPAPAEGGPRPAISGAGITAAPSATLAPAAGGGEAMNPDRPGTTPMSTTVPRPGPAPASIPEVITPRPEVNTPHPDPKPLPTPRTPAPAPAPTAWPSPGIVARAASGGSGGAATISLATLEGSITHQPLAQDASVPISGWGTTPAPDGAAPMPTAPAASDAAPTRTVPVAPAIRQLVVRALERGETEARMLLDPPELGRVRVLITEREGVLRLGFDVATPAARDALLSGQPQLQALLREQGLELGELHVGLEGESDSTGEHEPRSGSPSSSASTTGPSSERESVDSTPSPVRDHAGRVDLVV